MADRSFKSWLSPWVHNLKYDTQHKMKRYSIRNSFQFQVLNNEAAASDTSVDHSLNIISNFEQILDFFFYFTPIAAGIYLLEVNNKNPRARCEICSKLTIKIPEQHQWRGSGIFFVNFEHISHLVLVFL